MSSDITRHEGWLIRVFAMKIMLPILSPITTYFSPNGMLRTTTKSASDLLRAAFDTKELGEYPKGKYMNGTDDTWPISKEALNEKNREMVWRDSLEYAKVVQGDTVLATWKS